MTEGEWQACRDPQRMLNFVRGAASERKLRLFACACARIVWSRLNEPQREAIEAAERVADGVGGAADLVPHRKQGLGVAAGTGRTAAEEAIRRAGWINHQHKATGQGGYSSRGYASAFAEVHLLACDLARCVFAPHHPRPERPGWRSREVVAVAQAAYAERPARGGALAPLRLMVLADALEEAGCDSAELLRHLRSPGPHVCGCWAVDLALGEQ